MDKAKTPDCETCWKKDDCVLAVFGKFCPQWQSAEPEPKKPDPNDMWRRGEETDI